MSLLQNVTFFFLVSDLFGVGGGVGGGTGSSAGGLGNYRCKWEIL
jgi:hypothetical protein